MASVLATHLDDVLELLGTKQDIVAGRPQYDAIPEWAAERGWAEYLAGLSDEQVAKAEHDPAAWLAVSGAPPSLKDLGNRAGRLAKLYEHGEAMQSMPEARRHVKKRKAAQLQALCSVAIRRFAGVSRIVDLGSGHGHLTRALALALRPNEALGIDWDDARIARAIDLSGAPDANGLNSGPRFVHGDASAAEPASELSADDLVTGLHPCGSLGDALVARARKAGAHVMAVSCCYQKTLDPFRNALSEQGRRRAFVVPQHALGLANLSAKSFDGSGTLESKRAGRRTRLALRLALEARGVDLEPGAEGRGVSKEQVRHGLGAIAPNAFAVHGLSAPTQAELKHAERRAERAHAHVSRFALPRHALARALELSIVLDRARYLEEAGWRTDVVPLFPVSTSPRNLGILANAPE